MHKNVDIMKRIIYVILLIIIYLPVFSQKMAGKWVIKTKEIPMLKCINNEFENLIDSIFTKERICNYNTDSLILSVRILKYEDDWEILFDTGTESEKRVFLGNNPIGFFRIKKHTCYVYRYIPESLFVLTKEKQRFKYRDYIRPKKLKKGEIPVIFPDDDSFSSWVYLYNKGKFILQSEEQPCIRDH